MSTTSRHRMKFQAAIEKCQVEIVDLKGSYSRSAGSKWAAILDGTELCRVEEFAARHFRRSGFEAVFLESAPFQVLFGVYFWSVIQDRCDRRVRMVGILDRHAYDQRRDWVARAHARARSKNYAYQNWKCQTQIGSRTRACARV